MEERLEKLLEDPSFQEAFSKTASAEEASALFAQHGIQITPEELTTALAQVDGELNEDALNEVAGGALLIGSGFRLPRWKPMSLDMRIRICKLIQERMRSK